MPFIKDAEGNYVYTDKAIPQATQLSNTTGVELDKYESYSPSEYIKGEYDQMTWNDERAKQQSGTEKVLRSTGQMVGTFGTALASGLTALVSGTAALGAEAITGGESEGMDIFLNNPVMKGIDDFDKYLKEDLLPTYYTKEQQESLLSASTGTDLLNGVGFMASALVPNAAINKLFGGWSKMVAANQSGKLSQILSAAEKVGEITNIESQVISKTANAINKAGPITGAVVGRIGESAMEANDVYQNLISQGISEEEAKRNRDNVFMGNMALALSDVAQYTRWFKGSGLGDDLVKQGLKTTVKNKTKEDLISGLLKESGQEAAEEGYQFLLQKGAEKSARGKSFIEGISEASGDLFGTIEGQKSMLLGAVLGGGVSTIADRYSAKENKARLQSMADSLTANADTNQRYITDPETGKRIVNPELTKTATRFIMYEQMKDEALTEGDQNAYNVAEKMQFADLIADKLEVGQYDAFITEIENMGKTSAEEVKQMFGELPIKNGREMTPSEVASEKIGQAKKVKQMTEGLSLLPKLQGISKGAMSFIRHKLFAQEALRNQIQEVDAKLADIQSRAVITPVDEKLNTYEHELLPQDKFELQETIKDKQRLLANFNAAAEDFKQYVDKPVKAQEKVDEIQTNNIKEAIENEVQKVTKEQQTIAEAVNNNTEIEINGEKWIVTGENHDTGNPIITNSQTGETQELERIEIAELLSNDIDGEETNDPQDVPSNNRVNNIEQAVDKDSDVKETQLSSSGQAILIENGYEVYEDGERQLNPEFIDQTELFNNPTFSQDIVSNPGDESKVITFKATLGTINLEETNARRLDRGLAELTKEDLEKDDFIPIQLEVQSNGKGKGITSFFHTPDYYEKTQAYTSIEKLVEKGELSEDQANIIHEQNRQKQREIRSKLVNQIKTEKQVIILTSSKSNGKLNFNPSIDGMRKTSALSTIFGKDFLFPKTHKLFKLIQGKAFPIKTRGVMVVKSTSPQGKEFKIEVLDSKNNIHTITQAWEPPVGSMLYDIITPNGSIKTINPFTKNSFSDTQIENMANLINHRLTTGETSIQVGKTNYQIIGNEANPGIIDSLIYIGTVKSTEIEAINSQLLFNKQGNLVLGKQVITAENLDSLEKITNHLNQFKSKPQFKPRSIEAFPKFGIPTQTTEGWIIENPVSYQNYLFGEENPLISTSLNKTKFLNVYFNFATDNNGDILTEGTTEEVKEGIENQERIEQNQDQATEEKQKEAECKNSIGSPNDIVIDDSDIPLFDI